MTHFAAADNLAENEFTNRQIKRFDDAVKIFEENGFRPKYKDLANSPATVAHDKFARKYGSSGRRFIRFGR